jgi:DNA-binding transcriptional MerR regulator
MFSIGEISAKTGVKITTIRYYEKMTLMLEPIRTSGNQRRYPKSALDQLVFIKHARDLGFSLNSIRKLIDMSKSQKKDCDKIDKLAKEHLEQVRAKLSLLKSLETELIRMTSGCDKDQLGKCYVIESLASHELCSKAH